MKLLGLLGLAGICLIATPAMASPAQSTGHNRAQIVSMSFRLHVVGNTDPGATFWVAYGPVDGRFGLVQLRRLEPGVFQAMDRIRIGTRSVFAYLEGHGVVKTRFGNAPGDPVFTIRRVGPVTVTAAGVQSVRWRSVQG